MISIMSIDEHNNKYNIRNIIYVSVWGVSLVWKLIREDLVGCSAR